MPNGKNNLYYDQFLKTHEGKTLGDGIRSYKTDRETKEEFAIIYRNDKHTKIHKRHPLYHLSIKE